jgi:hypothetical protein
MKAATAKKSVTQAAMARLRSVYFFLDLAGELRRLGLYGKDRLMALGVYFVAVSRFHRYPLRIQIQERTEGTAVHIVNKVADFLVPDSVVKLKPTKRRGWDQLAEAPDQRIVFIPQWTEDTESGLAGFRVLADRVMRRIPFEKAGRTEERVDELKGRFACISADDTHAWIHDARWLTTTQAVGEQVDAGYDPTTPTSEPDFGMWHEIDRLLQERAKLPILLPEWEQVLVETAQDKGTRGLEQIPTLLQLWRTMCLIRSFQSDANNKAEVLSATFDDLAEMTFFAKKVFRGAIWFPSMATLYNRLPKVANETSVLNPMTGKYFRYRREMEKVTVQWQNPLYWKANGI